LSSNTPTAGPNDQSSGTLGDPSVGLNNISAAPSDTVAAEASIPSGAKLTSSLPPSGGAFATAQPGPSIPFNPESSTSSTAANDLISAADDDIPSLDSLPTSPSDSTASPSESPSATSTVAAQMASSSSKLLEPAQPRAILPFRQAREQALQLAQQGKLVDALELMTQYYESPELGYAEHTDLVDLLDALSREVIYSSRHTLSTAHTVTAQESLTSLAEKSRITPELLAAINQLGESPVLAPNSKLKVIEGPFRAQISLSRGELTLFLRKMYAGRFPVSVSQVNKPAIGNYEIVDRRQDRTFYGANTVIPAGAPNNPYGKYWLSLGGNLAIHGSPEQVTSDLEGAGCISLAPLDAADAFRILSKGAAVEVRP
jgi:LysM repeat protein